MSFSELQGHFPASAGGYVHASYANGDRLEQRGQEGAWLTDSYDANVAQAAGSPHGAFAARHAGCGAPGSFGAFSPVDYNTGCGQMNTFFVEGSESREAFGGAGGCDHFGSSAGSGGCTGYDSYTRSGRLSGCGGCQSSDRGAERRDYRQQERQTASVAAPTPMALPVGLLTHSTAWTGSQMTNNSWSPSSGNAEQDLARQGNATGACFFKMLLPQHIVPVIIGKDGVRLQAIARESSCALQVSAQNDFFPGTGDRIVIGSGTMSSLEWCIALLLRRIEHVAKNASRMFCKFVIPSSAVSSIIGRNGEEMKRLNSSTGCLISVSPRVEGIQERLVLIAGEFDGLQRAVNTILREVQKDRHLREHMQLKYDIDVPIGAWRGGSSAAKDPGTPLLDPEAAANFTKRELLEYLQKAAPKEILHKYHLLGQMKNMVRTKAHPEIMDAVRETWTVRGGASGCQVRNDLAADWDGFWGADIDQHEEWSGSEAEDAEGNLNAVSLAVKTTEAAKAQGGPKEDVKPEGVYMRFFDKSGFEGAGLLPPDGKHFGGHAAAKSPNVSNLIDFDECNREASGGRIESACDPHVVAAISSAGSLNEVLSGLPAGMREPFERLMTAEVNSRVAAEVAKLAAKQDRMEAALAAHCVGREARSLCRETLWLWRSCVRGAGDAASVCCDPRPPGGQGGFL
eukprot:TRINITY_DN29273_c0_g1_i2.p1 TRINITY_DN29273_c0_g1~~TRINITY_DN29273_c0_g1_i2.p1  ORF type:complete len:683 (-),score=104.20 TRINITY_DN29273_c0_g1_i2:283-2331(-)